MAWEGKKETWGIRRKGMGSGTTPQFAVQPMEAVTPP